MGEKLMSSEINLITLFSPYTFNSSLSWVVSVYIYILDICKPGPNWLNLYSLAILLIKWCTANTTEDLIFIVSYNVRW